jgi:hypothetical protein
MMKAFTFKNGDFVLTIPNQKFVTTARRKLGEVLRIIEGQVAFDSVPKATDFDLIDVQRVSE